MKDAKAWRDIGRTLGVSPSPIWPRLAGTSLALSLVRHCMAMHSRIIVHSTRITALREADSCRAKAGVQARGRDQSYSARARLQVKDQSNAAFALRQIYQKHLEPYEKWCCQQQAAEARLESRSAPSQCSAAYRKGEIGENMAAQVLKAMLVASSADVVGSEAALRNQAEARPKKRRRTQQVCVPCGHEPPQNTSIVMDHPPIPSMRCRRFSRANLRMNLKCIALAVFVIRMLGLGEVIMFRNNANCSVTVPEHKLAGMVH